MSVEDVRFYLDRGLLPRARRRRGRRGDLAYHQEHVERLGFIGRALNFGFSFEDIERFVDPTVNLTCSDVYRVAAHQLEELQRLSGRQSPPAVALERLMATCPGTGGRQDCRILAFLSTGTRDGDKEMGTE